METVSNLASGVVNTASRAIWGDGTTETKKDIGTTGAEPVSGETGNVKAGEPYDKGNLDSIGTESTRTETTKPSTTESTSLPSTTDTTTPATTFTDSEHDASKTDVTPSHDPSSSLAPSDQPTSSTDTSKSKSTPSGGPPALTGRPAHEHEAGQHGTGKSHHEPKSAENVTASKTGGDGLQKQGADGVAGEKPINSSGEHAEERNLNAATYGSGVEADGPSVGPKSSPPTSSNSGSKGDTPTKVSLKDKLKAKLHRHKDSKEL